MKLIEEELNDLMAKDLYFKISQMKNGEEVAKFLRDIMTYDELAVIIQRYEIAKMLKADITFREIERLTGASSATISRVNYWLHHGCGGYEIALKDMDKVQT